MKIEINKKNSNSIDNPTYLIRNEHQFVVDKKGRHIPCKKINYTPQAKFARRMHADRTFGLSLDSPFETEHTLFHPSSERIQLSPKEERDLKRNSKVPAFLANVPNRKGMFRRICEKSVPVDKQHILNFYNSKETIKNLLVKIGGTSPKDADRFANKAIGNVHFLNK